MTVTLQDVRAAADALRGSVVPTPCLYSRTLSSITGAQIYLKFENHQFTASFKERGALNKLLSLTPLPHPDGKEFAYREGDWKLISNHELEPIELYDLAHDPLEFFNLLASEPARAAALSAAFRRHHAAVRADPLRPTTEQTNY